MTRESRTFLRAGHAVALSLLLLLGIPGVAAIAAGATTLSLSARIARIRPPLLRFAPEQQLASGVPLAGVSCASAASCVVFDDRGRAYHYDGSHWAGPRSVAGAASGPGSVSVSCSSPAMCIAVPTGSDEVASWNGKTWSAPTALYGAIGLEAVGCARSGYCAAVDAEGNSFSLSGQSWQRTAGDWGSVRAISCVSATFCVSAAPTGISIWDGTHWTVPATFPGAFSFTGVSCPSMRFCTAVDNTGNALQWNGSRWSAAVRIEPGRQSATTLGPGLTAVSCPTASFCVAVDTSGAVLQWRDGIWSRTYKDGKPPLTAVSCPDDSFCVATARSGAVLVGRP